MTLPLLLLIRKGDDGGGIPHTPLDRPRNGSETSFDFARMYISMSVRESSGGDGGPRVVPRCTSAPKYSIVFF